MFHSIGSGGMHFEVRGEGRPILMLHGFRLDSAVMRGCMEPLFEYRKGWKRIYVDLPGMGLSPRIEGLNDSDEMLTGLARFVSGELGPDIPVHFTRFHPDYQLLNLSPTPVETLERARDIAMKAGIRYAYVGNVPGHPGNNTYCPSCGAACIERSGLFVTAMHMKNGTCAKCGTKIAGVWS